MEENNPEQIEQPTVAQEQTPAPPSPPEVPSKKSNKLSRFAIISLAVLGAIVLVFVLISPILIKAINPEAQIKKAKMEAALSLTPKPTSTPTRTSTPTVSIAPTITVGAAVKTTPVPTKAAGQLMLFVNFYNLNGENHTVSVTNTATGVSTSQSGTGEFNYFYNLADGHYSVTANQVNGRTLATSSPCYDCTTSSGNFNANGPDYTVYLDLKNGHTNGVFYGFASK